MSQPDHILDHDQYQAAVKAAQERYAQIKGKYHSLKAYLVLCIPGKQTEIWSSPAEILASLPALLVDTAAKNAFAQHLRKPPDKDDPAHVKKQWTDRRDELSRELQYDGRVRVEIRFNQLDYALIAQLQPDELVDRDLTPQTRASIRIVLGTLTHFLDCTMPT